MVGPPLALISDLVLAMAIRKHNTPDHRYARLGFEHEAWYETSADYYEPDSSTDHEEDDSNDDEDTALGLITIRFHEPLSEATFNRFIDLGLQRRTSRFRIGGYLTRRGPTKVHLAAIDRHLWQPFLMEATSKQLLEVLPSGTCGNTIHRLVTNVQRYLNPRIDVWLASKLYAETVADSIAEAA